MKKKAWVSLVAVVLVLCCAVGGTLAWLTELISTSKNQSSYLPPYLTGIEGPPPKRDVACSSHAGGATSPYVTSVCGFCAC